jgi:mannose-6-phosphate isomerase-like protein (cupin superfamily)
MGSKKNSGSKNSEKKRGSTMSEQSSWVNFTVLDIGAGYKVKRVEVFPRKQLSYQKHQFHTEQWVIVQGTAKVTMNNRVYSLRTGETVTVGAGQTSIVENPDPSELLIFIKIRCGSWLDEDDHIRFSGDYKLPMANL